MYTISISFDIYIVTESSKYGDCLSHGGIPKSSKSFDCDVVFSTSG